MKGRPILYVFCLVEKHKVLIPNSRIGVFDPAAGKIDILTFVKKERMEEFLLTDLQIIEQPPVLGFSHRWKA